MHLHALCHSVTATMLRCSGALDYNLGRGALCMHGYLGHSLLSLGNAVQPLKALLI